MRSTTPRKAPGIAALVCAGALLTAAVSWTGHEAGPLVLGTAVANAPVTGIRGRLQATVLSIKDSINDLGVSVTLRTLDHVELTAYVSAEAGAHLDVGHTYEFAGHTDRAGLWLVDVPGSVRRIAEELRLVRVFTGCIKEGALLPAGPLTPFVYDGCYTDLHQYSDGSIRRQ
jgi:hypothetical protein